MHLRDLNPYVATALGDWRSKQQLTPAVPLSHGPRASKHDMPDSAGAATCAARMVYRPEQDGPDTICMIGVPIHHLRPALACLL